MHASAARLQRGVEAGAGARVRRRMPSRCWFSTTGQHATSPSAPRTATIDSSRSNGDEAFEDQRHAAEFAPTPRRRRPARAARPGPCRRSRRGGSSAPRAGRARRPRASRSARDRRPRRNGAVAIAERAGASSFSTRRSCETSSARGRREHRRDRLRARGRSPAGTPSHS